MNLSQLTVGVVLCASLVPAFAASDNFNRTDLGTKWVSLIGDRARISNHKFVAGLAYMKYTPAAADTRAVATIAATGKDVGHYAGLFVGKASVKFRTNASDMIEVVCFEPTIMSDIDVPGTCFTAMAGDFTAFKKARVTMQTTGTMASIDIDTNKDGSPEYSFKYDFGAAVGGGVGLMGNNEIFTIDNLSTGQAD
ncbi:hypothetical protein AACH06_19325 [Ideonella sp. DXS29W]|uniref:Uncharacterized protein n=1 Tax=Ideonella lacteola TaxID=2984193 RepID=A0ABU9BSN2_9BURK